MPKSSVSTQASLPLQLPFLQAVQLELKAGEHTAKDDASPVTVADYGAQALVAWSLQQSYPGEAISLVAEEDSADLRCEGVWQVCWQVTEAGRRGATSGCERDVLVVLHWSWTCGLLACTCRPTAVRLLLWQGA